MLQFVCGDYFFFVIFIKGKWKWFFGFVCVLEGGLKGFLGLVGSWFEMVYMVVGVFGLSLLQCCFIGCVKGVVEMFKDLVVE